MSKISNLFWRIAAKQLARPAVVDWLIKRAMKTPYTHITSKDGMELYMARYWLFNPYPPKSMGKRPRWQFPISIRLHRIMREDFDRVEHDHPWNARTIILRGRYVEQRKDTTFMREPGQTATLSFEEYHRIIKVLDGGVWTMFITGKYRGVWGFLVDDVKVPFYDYLK